MLPLVILAGGLAKRMRPITETIPKSLIPVLGRPFIGWQLDLFAKAGFSKIIVCTGHLGNLIEDYVGDGSEYNLEVSYSNDGNTLLGTGGAIKQVTEKIKGKFLVTYGDSYLPIPFGEVSRHFIKSPMPTLMTILNNQGKFDTSNVIFNAGQIQSYQKNTNSELYNYIDFGLLGVSSETLSEVRLPNAWDLSIFLSNQVDKGLVSPFEVHNKFYEIGSPSGLNDLEEFLKGS